MSLIEIIIISISLAMDAFAVSVTLGLSMKKSSIKRTLMVGFYFGLFQAIMPVIGYFLALSFESFITSIDHWIAFGLLGIIGLKMIKEAFEEEHEVDDDTSFKTMIVLAIATSIDALAVGITFAFLKVDIFSSALMIGVITFLMSIIGVKIASVFGKKLGNKAEIIGGLILVVMGIKILVEHLNIL